MTDSRAPRSLPAIETFFERTYRPAIGRISDAADPCPSPDSGSVAFTATVWRRLEARPGTQVAVVALGGEGLRVIPSSGNDRLPRWSPDGRRLGFLSDRASPGLYQLFIAPAADLDHATPAPTVAGTVEYFSWSPDGKTILLGVAAPGADLSGAQGSGTMAGATASGADSWRPDVAGSTSKAAWRTAWLLNVDSMELTRLSTAGRNVWEATWLGSDRVAALVADAPGEESWYGARVAVLETATRAERVVYRSRLELGMVAGSPAGDRVAVIEARSSDRGVMAGSVLLIDAETGDITRADARGADVTCLSWAGGSRLGYAGLRGLQTVVGELVISGDRVECREEWASEETCGVIYPEASPLSGGGVVLVAHSYRRPAELAVVSGGALRTILRLGHEGTDYQLEVRGTIRPVTWRAKDGLEIQGLLCLPSGNGPHALIVHIHGGPVYAFRNSWALMMGAADLVPGLVSRGFAVLNVNPRGSGGRGIEFASQVYGDPGGADAGDIEAGVDHLISEGIVDRERVGLTGRSYGGFMSAWLVTQTDRFRASVPRAPVTNWYSFHHTTNVGPLTPLLLGDPRGTGKVHERSPVMYAHRVKTPVLVMAGALDRCAPPTQAVEFHQALVEHGADASLVIYPEEGHHVLRYEAKIDELARIVDFFEWHLGLRSD